MALGQATTFDSGPIKLGSTNVAIHWGTTVPDGNTSPWVDMLSGSLYLHINQTVGHSALYQKIAENDSNDDWQLFWVDEDEGGRRLDANLRIDADNKIEFRDDAIFAHSNADGELLISADSEVNIGDGTNQLVVKDDGEVNLDGTAKVKKIIPLPIILGGGTSNIEAWNDGATINFDVDAETYYAEFMVPQDWDAAGDMTYVAFVGNEIAEDDGDDVSFALQVAAYADGETASAAGQAVAVLLDLTGGDEAINKINKCTGTIDYNHGVYPLARGDTVQVKGVVNLGGAGECTGPLHICSHYVEYTSDRLGEAT